MPGIGALVNRRAFAAILLGLVALVAFVGWAYFANRNIIVSRPLTLPSLPPAPGPGEEVLLAVGDIGSCDGNADEKVAELASELPGTIALLGDTVYPNATARTLADCLQPAWGPMLDRIRPAVGNHDYTGADASAYFSFFGDAAGPAGEGWYSYDLGAWHIVVLNSNCSKVSCDPASPQLEWLAGDLAAHPSDCLAAVWHHPRFGSGRHGMNQDVDPLWQAVVAAGVDVVLNGHDHSYERLEVDGVAEFVVGTGGRSLYRFENSPLPQTVVRHDGSYGLLHLVLGEGTYAWQFLQLGSSDFTDQGAGRC